jgi:hypothetical protein
MKNLCRISTLILAKLIIRSTAMSLKILPFTISCFLVLVLVSKSFNQTCPEQVKKTTVSEGAASSLPDGWFAYSDGAIHKGVYVSPLKSFTPRLLAGTSNDIIFEIDISSDGRWILYGAGAHGNPSNQLYLIKPDGTARTHVKVSAPVSDIICGFVKNGPSGTEIFFRTATALRAIKADLSGDAPVLGSERTLVNIPFPQTMGSGESGGVAGNHVYGNYQNVARMLTIPDNGKGVGTQEHFHAMTGKMEYSCANTIAPSGKMVAQNPGENEDGSGCIPIAGPGWSLNLNHKGLVVLPFFENTALSIAWIDMYRSKSLSVNWCPVKFRYGGYNESGFVRWYFANNEDYVIGARNASKDNNFGAWIVNWKTNQWTLVSAATTKVDEPAVHFNAATAESILHRFSASGSAPVQLTGEYLLVSTAAPAGTAMMTTLHGRIVRQWSLSGTGSHRLHTAGIKKGIYLIRVCGPDRKVLHQFRIAI